MQIIISAGGGGTRLWPISTNEHPKQFVPILDPTSLFEQMYSILTAHFKSNNIWITTLPMYTDTIISLLPKTFPKNHILVEPERRDTFAAISAQAAIVSHHTSENEPLVFVPADDWLSIDDVPTFNHVLEKIGAALENDHFDFITVGIKPKYPATNYGYIQIKKSDIQKCFNNPVPVLHFKEKPDYKTALVYTESEDYLWHKHNPSFTFKNLKKVLKTIDPKTLEILLKVELTGKINPKEYSQIPKTSIDYAVFEKVDSMGVIGMNITWEDIGNWEVVYKNLPDLGENSNQAQFAGSSNKVRLSNPKRKVGFVGISGLLLVETSEGILVINPKFSSEVKKASEFFSKKF